MLRVLALASVASIAFAQSNTATGYGRFSCSVLNGDGTYSPSQAICDGDLSQVAPGTGDDSTGFQIDGATPVGSKCIRQPGMGFFCGIAGAGCTTDDNCDNGNCDPVTKTCQGGFGAVCGADDGLCTGYLYCTDAFGDTSSSQTCGGPGGYCNDGLTDGLTDAESQALFNELCSTGFCGTDGSCAERLVANSDCTDNIYACPTTQFCNPENVCQDNLGPSPAARARTRRSVALRGVCPASHTACAVSGSRAGFECIDTTSNLEQCGACASAGGVDCTTLPGVEGVACVAGQCEIWSCAESYSWNAASGACEASL